MTHSHDYCFFLKFVDNQYIHQAKWLVGCMAVYWIRPSTKIVQSIGSFNLLCSLGGSDFHSDVGFGAIVAIGRYFPRAYDPQGNGYAPHVIP
jgi:hypothetical protein